MSIIALTGVPKNMSVEEVLKPIRPLIRGHCEAMNFILNRSIKKNRIAFMRLSEKLDPVEVVEIINSHKRGALHAYIPTEVPDFPPLSKRYKIEMTTSKVVTFSRDAILQEMQAKYAGLFDLSASTAHKLLLDIGKLIYKRLRKILEQADDAAALNSCIRLTKMYRKRHPHFADFQLILSTLHSIQDAEGKPRDQILECDLASFAIQSYVIDNIPFDKVQQAYFKYLEKITATIVDHVKKLDMTPKTTSPEEIARIKIREQMKTLLPYLPACVKQATDHHFVPQESNFYTVHIYGEPTLPNKDSLNPFLKRHKVMSTSRSNRIYNMIILEVPKDEYLALLDEDGTLVDCAKLVIRPSNLPFYKVPRPFVKNSTLAATSNTQTSMVQEDK